MWFSLIMAAFAGTGSPGGAPVNEERSVPPTLHVSISVPCGSLSVTGGDEPSVKISGTVDQPEALDVESSAGSVAIDVAMPSCARLVVRVPRAAVLEIETMSAPITVQGVHAGMEIESLSGNIAIETDCTAVEAQTISGSITVRGAIPQATLSTVSGTILADRLSGSVELETVSGSVRFASGAPVGALHAESVSGPITAAARLSPGARVELESHSGPIVLAIPQTSSVTLTAETHTGRVTSAFGATGGRELWTTLGTGTGVITIETFSGPITVSRLEP